MRSEAVYVDLVTPHGRQGIGIRRMDSWLLGHVCVDGRVYAFTRHDIPYEAPLTLVERSRVSGHVPHAAVIDGVTVSRCANDSLVDQLEFQRI